MNKGCRRTPAWTWALIILEIHVLCTVGSEEGARAGQFWSARRSSHDDAHAVLMDECNLAYGGTGGKLAGILRRCLSAEPDERPDAADVWAVLNGLVEGMEAQG
ncbi:hypothetical protein FOA52_007117 [Chlamydomonas sp. UWO 241]|nr:hypothetical protein FOA52_007117 [Chlamydomonas sp. UWO 241]